MPLDEVHYNKNVVRPFRFRLKGGCISWGSVMSETEEWRERVQLPGSSPYRVSMLTTCSLVDNL